jgi:hypothetical protein
MLSKTTAQSSVPCVRTTITKKALPTTSDLSLENSAEPAPIDIVAFGRRLDEIITKAVRPSRKRPKSRK